LEKAEQALREALELFALEPADKPWPNWGRLDALARLGQVLADQDRGEEARAFYQLALEQAPDFVWVRDELLPALNVAGS
jgi:tetratricopeptide (TPR) repeat protein